MCVLQSRKFVMVSIKIFSAHLRRFDIALLIYLFLFFRAATASVLARLPFLSSCNLIFQDCNSAEVIL